MASDETYEQPCRWCGALTENVNGVGDQACETCAHITDPYWFRPLVDEPNPYESLDNPTHPWHTLMARRIYELPLTGFASEKDLADGVLARLHPWFHIEREVSGTHCSGKRLRIDAVIRPRQPEQWKDPAVAFGIEFKLPGKERGNYVFTGWAAQAADYAHVDWHGYGRMWIVTCPNVLTFLSKPALRPRLNNLNNIGSSIGVDWAMERLLSQLGVGYLTMTSRHGLTLMHNGNRLWSERDRVVWGKHGGCRPRAGNRGSGTR